MQLVDVDDNSEYFLFLDTFLQKFSLWTLGDSDKGYEIVKKYLKRCSKGSNRKK